MRRSLAALLVLQLTLGGLRAASDEPVVSPGLRSGLGPPTSRPAAQTFVFPSKVRLEEPPAERSRDATGVGPTVAGKPLPPPKVARPPRNWIDQTRGEADAKSAGCVQCHTTTDAHTMHASPNVVLGCMD